MDTSQIEMFNPETLIKEATMPELEALPTYCLTEATALKKKKKWLYRYKWKDVIDPSLSVQLEIKGLTEKELEAIQDNIRIRDYLTTIIHIVEDLRATNNGGEYD